MMMEKDEEGRKLRLRMDEIEMEKQMADLKNKRNNTIYNQKMSVIHDIELENKIYREEVNDLNGENKDDNLIDKENEEEFLNSNVNEEVEIEQDNIDDDNYNYYNDINDIHNEYEDNDENEEQKNL